MEKSKVCPSPGAEGGLLGHSHGFKSDRPTDDNAKVECVACRKTLPRAAFDADRLNVWKRNKTMREYARCNACFARLLDRRSNAPKQTWKQSFAKMPDRHSNAPKQSWKQSVLKCSVCNSALLPSRFHTGKLKQWEDSATLHLARCESCGTDMNTTTRTLACNLCLETKPADAFSPARQRHRDPHRRRCKKCDFPPCFSCGSMPTLPKQTPYMCPACLWLPCACGAPRLQYTQNRVTKKPTWQCKACRK